MILLDLSGLFDPFFHSCSQCGLLHIVSPPSGPCAGTLVCLPSPVLLPESRTPTPESRLLASLMRSFCFPRSSRRYVLGTGWVLRNRPSTQRSSSECRYPRVPLFFANPNTRAPDLCCAGRRRFSTGPGGFNRDIKLRACSFVIMQIAVANCRGLVVPTLCNPTTNYLICQLLFSIACLDAERKACHLEGSARSAQHQLQC